MDICINTIIYKNNFHILTIKFIDIKDDMTIICEFNTNQFTKCENCKEKNIECIPNINSCKNMSDILNITDNYIVNIYIGDGTANIIFFKKHKFNISFKILKDISDYVLFYYNTQLSHHNSDICKKISDKIDKMLDKD